MSAWLFLHLLGVVLWLGGGAASMVLAISSRPMDRGALGMVVRLQWAIVRSLMFPGALLTVVTGLFLTVRLMQGSSMGSGWLVTMQGVGLVGALLVLAVLVPTAARLARLDPMGDHAAYFDRLRGRQRVVGSISGLFGLVALLAGAAYRYGG